MRSSNPLTWVVLLALCILFTATGFAIKKNSNATAQAHRALCIERKNYATLIHEDRLYLSHPELIPGLNIPRGILLRSLTLNRQNLAALRDISC